MRIDRLLKRDEIAGFITVVERLRNGEASTAAPTGVAATDAAEETVPAKPRPAPLLGRGGRPPRRIRRAL